MTKATVTRLVVGGLAIEGGLMSRSRGRGIATAVGAHR